MSSPFRCVVLGWVVLSTLAPVPMHAQRGAVTLGYQLTYVDTGEPFPSPDGRKLVFLSRVAGFYQVFEMNTDGPAQMQITHDAANHDSPSWSPDGRKIAYVSDKTGHSVIYMMNPDGTGEERLSDDRHEYIHPTWSPDNGSILYCSDDDLKPPAKNPSEIYLLDIKTRKVTTLISGGTNTYPSLSPDGRKIVFRRMLGEMNSEVFVAAADGSGAQNLTNHPAFDGWPAWSPDGTRIAFASNRNANYQIFHARRRNKCTAGGKYRRASHRTSLVYGWEDDLLHQLQEDRLGGGLSGLCCKAR